MEQYCSQNVTSSVYFGMFNFVLLFYPIFYMLVKHSFDLLNSSPTSHGSSVIKENYFRNRGMALILPCSILKVDVSFSVLK